MRFTISVYRSLISEPGVSKRPNVLKMALGFYDDIINDEKQPYLAEAYYNSGLILARLMEPKDVKEGIRRLEEAYSHGDLNLKIMSAFYAGHIAFYHAIANEEGFTFGYAEAKFKEVQKLAQGSEIAKMAQEFIKKIHLINPK